MPSEVAAAVGQPLANLRLSDLRLKSRIREFPQTAVPRSQSPIDLGRLPQTCRAADRHAPGAAAAAERPRQALARVGRRTESGDGRATRWTICWAAGRSPTQSAFEPESLQSGRVVAIRRDDVFVEFGGREQGIVSLRLFDVPPQVGAEVQVVVQRLNPEDGLYELSMPNKAVQVDDWSDLAEGMLVDVRVTGHNTGGLECEVNHIRGFIPVSQIALYRVEDLAQFVDQRFTCMITEANPERRNLVLSRRAVLEREREEARQQMLASLQPGQIRDGVVRKLMDFGAFVDLGGVDGLLHISQLAWGRVKHPSDVLHEGQQIKVRVEKVDPETGKISLAYRDLLESPWTAGRAEVSAQHGRPRNGDQADGFRRVRRVGAGHRRAWSTSPNCRTSASSAAPTW